MSCTFEKNAAISAQEEKEKSALSVEAADDSVSAKP
jgi:hypothetical protein